MNNSILAEYAGRVENCFFRLDTTSEPAILEIFFSKSTGEDHQELSVILKEPYIKNREWFDSGLRLFLKGIPPKKVIKKTRPLIEKIAVYFTNKYPDDVFYRYKQYPCAPMSNVFMLHFNQTIVLKYCEELRKDFTKNFCKVVFNETGDCKKVYINCYEAGTLEYKSGFLEMHRWESEDEAQSLSYFNRHYTQRLLDGVVEGTDIKTRMIELVRSSMSSASIETEDRSFFVKALDFLEKTVKEKNLEY